MRLIFLSLLLLVAAAVIVRADGISVSQSLDKSQLAFDDSATFEITLQWPGSQFAYRFPQPLDPQFEKLRVGRFESSVTSKGSGAGEITYKTFRYTLLPLAAGEGRIEPVRISYLTAPDSIPGEVVTEGMSVTIAAPPPIPEQRRAPLVWVWVAVWTVLVAGAVAAGVMIRKRRRAVPPVPVKTPKDKALEELASVRKEAGEDLKRFQAGVYRVLADYLQARFDIRADELDDQKLVEAIMGTDLPAGARSKLADWVVTARMDKFRPVAGAPGETLRRASDIREMLETT